jgi:hypothetical protein
LEFEVAIGKAKKAAVEIEEREEERTRVDDRTVFRRGKSDIPESRMDIEESRRERELRND